MSTARTAATGAAWTIVSSLLARGVSLVGTFLLIRFVTPGDFGEACAAAVVVATVNEVATLGVGIYVIANREITRQEVFHATFIHLTLGVLAALVLLVLGRSLAPLFDTPHLFRYVPGLVCAALMDRVAFMPERVLVRALKFKRIGLIRSSGETLYALVSVAFAIAGWGGMSVVMGNLARSAWRLVAMVGSVHLREWLEVARLRWSVMRKIAGYGFAVSLNGMANFAAGRWDNLLVSRFFGPAVMATYNFAYNLAELPAIYVGEQVTDVMQAAFAHMGREERQRILLRSIGVLCLVTFPLAIGLGAVAPSLVQALLDKKWAGVAPMLMILSTLSVLRPPYGAVWSYILAEKGPNVLVVLGWVNVGLLMAGIATVGRISPLWTCAVVGIVFGIRMFLGMFVSHVLSGVKIGALLARVAPPLLACLPMAATVFGLRAGLTHLGVHQSVLRLIAEVTAGALVFVPSALLLAPTAAREVLGLIRDRLQRRAVRL